MSFIIMSNRHGVNGQPCLTSHVRKIFVIKYNFFVHVVSYTVLGRRNPLPQVHMSYDQKPVDELYLIASGNLHV